MHHCKNHRPAARHRRTTTGDHVRRLTTLAAVFAAMLGVLYAVPGPAQADQTGGPSSRGKALSTVRAATVRHMTDYGSGAWGGPTSSVVRTGDPATADYTLIGDSIGNRCTADLRGQLLAKGKTLATITQSGQDAKGLVDLLLGEPAIGGKLIMEAGTNNVFQPPTIAAELARAQTWATDNGVEMYWGDTYVGRPAYPSADQRNSGWVNSYIYSAIPFDHVLKWQPALGGAVGRGRALSYYLEDGVHPWQNAGTGHGDGCAFFAAVYVGGLGL